ncbi:MAG TPA: nuclear transport factor 2 family protein [Terriglobales bacterium]|nr:nuclear transport factor 2 family protein [Terriglobales bacterium]
MYRPSASSAPASGFFLDVETIIRNLTQDYCTAFNTGNYDQAASLYAPDASYMPPNRETAVGTRAIERLLRELGESGHQELRYETLRVDVSGDLAVELGRYSVAIRQGNGTTVADRGKYLRAWRRVGAWSIIADSSSSDLPQLVRA